MEEKILEIMYSVFAPCNVTVETSQKTCEKWDSLNHLNLIVELEDAFDMEFDPEEIAEMKSFKAVIEKIISKQS